MDIDVLEQELRNELEKFEHIFEDEMKVSTEPTSIPKRKLTHTLSQFAAAQAEGEKEQLEDQLYLLSTRGEEKDRLLADAQSIIIELTARNEKLGKENNNLKVQNEHSSKEIGKGVESAALTEAQARAALAQIESVLNETRQQFVAIQRELESSAIHKAKLEKELTLEQHRRITAEKERDAYASAYETSLKHFEAWNSRKHQLKSGTGSPRR